MPAANSRSTITRQWELLKLLPPRSPGLTASNLRASLADAGYECSKRTIERDLVELSRILPIQCNDKSIPFGWHWSPGQSAQLPGVTLSEALTLSLVESSIRPLIPAAMLRALEPRFSMAHRKLEAMSASNAPARWLDKVASVQPELAALPPRISGSVLENVQQAILENLQLDGDYYSIYKNQTASFTLNPHALVQRGNTTYLIATVGSYTDIRQFPLHRFTNAITLGSPALIQENFDLAAYIQEGGMQFGNRQKIRLEAWVTAQLSRLLQESPISEDMQLVPEEEGAKLTATVTSSWELRWWLLSHTGSIVVNRPAMLRSEIIRSLESGLELYG